MEGLFMLFLKTKNIARFEKVSYEEFKKTYIDLFLNTKDNDYYSVKPGAHPSELYFNSCTGTVLEPIIQRAYSNIKVPQAQTTGSAGHDFTVPFSFYLGSTNRGDEIPAVNTTIIIPSGIKVKINKGWVLEIFPRSGWGFKGLKIENTVPIIDQDYYNEPKHEGHIMIKITNENKDGNDFDFEGGNTRFVQGLFKIYGTAGKPKKDKRAGGINSTSKEGSLLK
jgi:dUTP pyrophosphatase